MNHLTTSIVQSSVPGVTPTCLDDGLMLGRRIQAREPAVQNIRQLEAALHREWQQLSQQDIRRLTGGMRRRVEAVIQARGGYTRY
jgi:ABC-type iron transport system FetAB ATPase subunit